MSDATDDAIREGILVATETMFGFKIKCEPAWLTAAVAGVRKRLPSHIELGNDALDILGREFIKRVKSELRTVGSVLDRRANKALPKALAIAIPMWIAHLEQIDAALYSFLELKDVGEALEFISMTAERWAELVVDNEDLPTVGITPDGQHVVALGIRMETDNEGYDAQPQAHITIEMQNCIPHLRSNPDNVEVVVVGQDLGGCHFEPFVLELEDNHDD